MAASIAYRLGPFGFLNEDAVADARTQNLGLKDQRLALHWIQENIGGFGGDPTKVTIWGESAGAASVGFHITAFNGRNDFLFRAVIMESGNPIAYGALNASSAYQAKYVALVTTTGCSNASSSLQCLREVPLFVLNNVLNTTEFNSGWAPALDGDFIARLGSEQLADGSFVHVPIISGANSDEGTAFSPLDVNTTADFVAIVNTTTSEQSGLLPDLVKALVDTYFDTNASDYLIPSSQSLGGDLVFGAPHGSQYRHSAAYWGDEVFIAPRRLTCQTWTNNSIPAYSYHFNAIPAGIPFQTAVTHFQEVAFVLNNLEGLGYAIPPFEDKPESFDVLSDVMSKSWASFVNNLDPNGWEGRREVPDWMVYREGMNMVWDANVTSYLEKDDFREVGMKLLNDNWALFDR